VNGSVGVFSKFSDEEMFHMIELACFTFLLILNGVWMKLSEPSSAHHHQLLRPAHLHLQTFIF